MLEGVKPFLEDRFNDLFSSFFIVLACRFLGARVRTIPGKNQSAWGCLNNSKQLTLEVLDVVQRYYNDVRVVSSGSKGYHINCLGYEVTDWTHYDSRNPLKSHEVATRRFTEVVKETCPNAFDESHYMSCRVM